MASISAGSGISFSSLCLTHRRTPKLGWFHLGADIKNTSPSVHLPRDAGDFFGRIVNQTTFLMVGTVEPRKGHALALDAFSQLWRDGYDFNLVVIGKKGWLVDDLADRMSACSKNGSTFYWFQGASDEFLERAYSSCSCLLAASEAEGFGLPLIEASFHNLPVLARDIAVSEKWQATRLLLRRSSAEGLIAGVLRWVAERADEIQSLLIWMPCHGSRVPKRYLTSLKFECV